MNEKQRSRKRIGSSFLIVITVLLLINSIAFVTSGDASELVVETAEHDKFDLAEEEKPVVVEFMTPTCIDCERLEENLKSIYPKYEGDFTFLSIDITNPDQEELLELKEDRDIPWQVGSGDEELFLEYQGISVPKLLIFDEDDILYFAEEGVISEEDIEEEMEMVLRGEAEEEILSDYGIYTLAVIGGIASFFSPCSFPLLPSYMTYYLNPGKKKSRDDVKNHVRGLWMGIKTSMGIVLIFGGVGIIVAFGGRELTGFIPLFQPVTSILLISIGIIILADVDLRNHFNSFKEKAFRSRQKVKISKEKSREQIDPFYYGIGYGLGAAGCTAPVFIAVLISSWLTEGYLSALLVLLLFLAPIVILMIAVSVLTQYAKDTVVNKLTILITPIRYISGVFLILVGTYILLLFL